MPNPNNNRQTPPGGPPKRNNMALVSVALWTLAITIIFQQFMGRQQDSRSTEIEYGVFRQMITEEKVASVSMTSDKYVIRTKRDAEGNYAGPDTEVTGVLTDPAAELEEARAALKELSTASPPPITDEAGKKQYDDDLRAAQERVVQLEADWESAPTYYCAPISDDSLILLLDEKGVVHYGYEPTSFWVSLLLTALPTILMVGLFALLMRGMASRMGGIGGPGGVGKANAKVYVEKKTGVTFRDVAGQDEAKESLVEIIDILHNPGKYTEIGAKLPKGALLVGPPGTGKTLLAKAVAGEANVPFFSISGSDFVEMFVGVGASRVRDLFKEASKMAPCIIFIDEIDTIGKSRDNRMGGNDEREQTLNQLLAELDGFDPTKGVIVLAATNRPEVLDKALLRPGRFDRRITIDRPNLAGRLATLQVHTRNIKLAEDVDLNKIALATAGCVGADLANLVNEAALRAVRKGRKLVTQEDLLASFEFVIAGSEKKNSVLTEFEKKLVAYHEVGHAMVAYKQKNAEPVQKITIVPHTEGSLGYTLLMPEEDKTNLRTKEELMAQITVSMGGRAAEEVVMNTMTNGASQDIQEATNIARNMVAMFGMSEEFGMMALGSVRSQYLDGGYGLDCAQDTAAVMDRAVKAILDVCYAEAVKVIRENREDMDKVADYLLAKETITGGEMVAIIEGRDPSLVENPYASTKGEEKGGSDGQQPRLDQSEGERKPPEGAEDQPEIPTPPPFSYDVIVDPEVPAPPPEKPIDVELPPIEDGKDDDK